MQKNNNIVWKKILFGTVAFVAVFSSEIALVIETTRLMTAGLIDLLPYILLVVSVVAMINFGINAIISKKYGSVGSMTVTMSLVILMSILSFYIGTSLPVFLFMAVFVGRLSSLIYDPAITNLGSSFCNVRQAKDFLPFIRGIMDFAFLVAAAYLYFSTGYIKIDPLWITIFGGILVIILIQIIDRNFDAVITGKKDETEFAFKERFKISMNFLFKKAPLFKYMFLFFVPIGLVAVVFVVSYNQVFVIHLSGDDMTRYVALLNFFTVLARAIYNFFFYKKSTFQFGLANLIIFYSLAMTVILGLLMFFPESLWIASVMYSFHLFSYFSYITVTTQEILGLVPKQLNQAIFFLIKGVTPGFFALLGALISAAVMYFADTGLAMIALFFIIMACSLVTAFKLKEEYQVSLEENLKNPDEFIKASAIDLMGETIQKEKGEKGLRKIVLDKKEPYYIRQKAIFSLVEIGNPNSIRELLLLLHSEENMRVKYYALQSIYRLLQKTKHMDENMDITKYLTLEAVEEIYEQKSPLPVTLEANRIIGFFGFEVLMDFYERRFKNNASEVKASIVELIATNCDRGVISLLEPLLDGKDMHVKTEAIIGLWKFPEMRPLLWEKMKQFFESDDDKVRVLALKIICMIGLEKMRDYVLDLISMHNKEVSSMALITALNLGMVTAYGILVKKLMNYENRGDEQAVEFVFRKFYLLPKKFKKKLIKEIKIQDDDVFYRLKAVFDKSNGFFDLDLANIFTINS